MSTPVYYNENDPKAAAWLRELIKYGHIAPGVVDERSILDVKPVDLATFTQCHFFAGIGGWSYALRLARWDDTRPVWTGSCPCQPFSDAGKGGGFADERHLWPAWFHLIEECRPGVIFGEQVASKDGLGWLDLVHTDMEGTGYAFAALDLCAAGVGAPHVRQRLYFVADSGSARLEIGRQNEQHSEGKPATIARGGLSYMAESPRQQSHWRGDSGRRRGESTDCSDMGDAESFDGELSIRQGSQYNIKSRGPSIVGPRDWSNAEFIPCTDGKARPIEPGTFPLAYGVPERVGLLRGYGNAIVAPLAATFIEAYLEC